MSGRLLVDDKGQDVLLKVLSGEAWGAHPWELRFYGKGPDEAYLVKLARHYGITDQGLLPRACRRHPLGLGGRTTCSSWPRAARGLRSRWWRRCSVGRPVVVTDVGGIGEWVAEPRNGFVAEAPTVRSFGAALERAWAAGDWETIGLQAFATLWTSSIPTPGGLSSGSSSGPMTRDRPRESWRRLNGPEPSVGRARRSWMVFESAFVVRRRRVPSRVKKSQRRRESVGCTCTAGLHVQIGFKRRFPPLPSVGDEVGSLRIPRALGQVATGKRWANGAYRHPHCPSEQGDSRRLYDLSGSVKGAGT